MYFACINSRKKFWKSYLLHRGDADNLQNFPKGLPQVQPALGDGHEQIGADGRPDLHPHTVGGSAEETPEAQMLFDPAEEQLDGPASAIDLGDEQRREVELVGDKDERIAGLRVHEADPTKFLGIVALTDQRVQLDGLVATQSGGLVDGAAPSLGNPQSRSACR